MFLFLLACAAEVPSVDPAVGPEAPPGTSDTADTADSGCASKEEPCNGVDDDCDGAVDEVRRPKGLVDADGDGFLGTWVECEGVSSTDAMDCADDDPSVHPDQEEVCNGKDDDCYGGADPEGSPGCIEGWLDADGDGLGGATGCFCEAGATQGGDCDDTISWMGESCALADLRAPTWLVITGQSGIEEVQDCDADGVTELYRKGSRAPMPAAGTWGWDDLEPTPGGNEDWTGDGICDEFVDDSSTRSDRYGCDAHLDYTVTDGASGEVWGAFTLDVVGSTYCWNEETTIDADGDGDRELLIYVDDGVSGPVYLVPMNGDEAEVLCEAGPFVGWGFAPSVDVDGDGIEDVPIYSGLTFGPAADNFCGYGWVSFDLWPYPLKFGDADGDGKADMVVSDASAVYVVPIPTTAGSYTAAAEAIATVGVRGESTTAVLTDADGDGRDDLVVLTRFPEGQQLHVYDHPLSGARSWADARVALNFAAEPSFRIAAGPSGLRIDVAATATEEAWTGWVRL